MDPGRRRRTLVHITNTIRIIDLSLLKFIFGGHRTENLFSILLRIDQALMLLKLVKRLNFDFSSIQLQANHQTTSFWYVIEYVQHYSSI